jgi:hypothetical protein
MRPDLRRIAVVAGTAVALTVPLAAPAFATGAGHRHGPTVTVLGSAVLPTQLAVSHGRVLVADAALSTISRVQPAKVLVTGPQPGETAGVAVDDRTGALAYTSLDFATGAARLTVLRGHHRPLVVDLSAFEARKNPDQHVLYGIKNPSQCVVDAFAAIGAEASYKGIVESHPYAVASLGGGAWAVADAAGNTLLRVDARGRVSVLSVLPRQPLTITADIAATVGLPDCVVGLTYAFEPVPTDVEVGPRGLLYVSTLPGGPEDPSLGARGSVYVVNPRTGAAHRLATGFSGATNLAVTPAGTVYVAELFAGRISTVRHGAPKPVVALPGALSVELGRPGVLYAGTAASTDDEGNPTGTGSVVRISLGG